MVSFDRVAGIRPDYVQRGRQLHVEHPRGRAAARPVVASAGRIPTASAWANNALAALASQRNDNMTG
jgi:hypothetical protein